MPHGHSSAPTSQSTATHTFADVEQVKPGSHLSPSHGHRCAPNEQPGGSSIGIELSSLKQPQKITTHASHAPSRIDIQA
jgi:hypothetical protein